MRQATKQYYVGVRLSADDDKQERYVFRVDGAVPSRESHGHLYVYVIGPFRTMAGAAIMAVFGQSNPHLQHVADAERMARRNKDMAATAFQHAVVR
jgi:hypothetical protein